MIEKYNEFILERMIKESTLYVSPDILKRLQSINSEISNDLLNQLGQNVKPDVTFLDGSDKDGELTFITMRNAVKKLSNLYNGNDSLVKNIENPVGVNATKYAMDVSKMLMSDDPGFWTQSRNPIKIGKLIRKIFPGKYSDVDIEKFVNEFKSSSEKDAEKFILVEGEDIDKYYWYESYREEKGDLGRSCMSRKKNLFDIYVKNPDVCKLLVLLENDKVIGRSLIWKIFSNNKSNDIEYFMDRQYTIEQSDVVKFQKYASNKGWAYKTYNNHYSFSKITFNGEEFYCDIIVKVDPEDYEYYPYMDTFRRYNFITGELFNDDDISNNGGQYLLDDTEGDFTEIEDGKWSEFLQRMVNSENAVWSEPYGDYLDETSSVYIASGDFEGWYYEEDDDIIYSDWEERYIHIDDCFYSNDMDEYILSENAVEGVYKILDDLTFEVSFYHERDDELMTVDKELDWYKVLCEKNSNWTNVDFIKNDLMKNNYKSFPKKFLVHVYKAEEEEVYLTVRDAKILGFKFDKEDKKEICDFEYHKKLEDAKLLSILIDKLVNDLIPNTENIADEGEDDMKKMYQDRIDRVWNRMPNSYEG